MTQMRLIVPATAACIVMFALCAPGARAQTVGWDVKAEANASLFFGNTRQTTLGTRFAAGHADSTADVRLDGQFTYGEAETAEQRQYVAKRSWRTGATADYRPFARVSPFVLASIESSLEKRIDRRYSGGGGAKLLLLRNVRTVSDLSLALLSERSTLRDAAGLRIEETLARYSTRFRLDHKVGERVTLSHETSYRPEVRAIDRFTFTSRTSVAFSMTSTLAFQGSFLDNYDSEARARGARSNNDGELLFGLAVTF